MSHSSGVVVWKSDGGALSVLIQGKCKDPKHSAGEILQGFPMGGGQQDEDPFTTALRELKEETGLVSKEGKDLKPVLIARKYKGDHTQFFFLVSDSDLEGELRKEVIYDGEDILFPPFWMPVSQLKFGLAYRRNCGQIMDTHKEALRGAIRHLERFRLVA